ncbi:DJ-1/PfpI family protein [Nonomuraea cavernae]|nr:DJ-1/PfpI family protein [Nonomuraea cavernae]
MKRPVHVGVYDTVADWETGHATAHLRSGRFHREPGGYDLVTVALTAEPITTMGGLRVTPDRTLDRLDPAGSALLILAGADLWDQGDEPAPFARKAREILRRLDACRPDVLDAWFRLHSRSDASAYEVLRSA